MFECLSLSMQEQKTLWVAYLYLHMNARTPQKPHAWEDFTQCSPHVSKQCAEVNGEHARKRKLAQTLEQSLQQRQLGAAVKHILIWT